MTAFTNQDLHRKCIEPVKRRKGSTTPQWQQHRFEIKGGISWRDAMIYGMFLQENHLIVEGPDGELNFRDIAVRIVEAA